MASKKTSLLHQIYRRLYAEFGPQGWWPGDTPLEVIVGAILTQNTAWTNVEKAITNLKLARALRSSRELARMPHAKLAALIRPAGYYNVKAVRIKNFMRYLVDVHGGNIAAAARTPLETLREDLLSVNGVGPETCDSILLYAFNKPVFVADAYTKRIFSRHGIVPADANYYDVQSVFMRVLPRSRRLYNEYHALIVRLAKEYCRAEKRCSGCPLKNIS